MDEVGKCILENVLASWKGDFRVSDDDKKDAAYQETAITVWQGPDNEMVSPDLGWVRKAILCAFNGMEQMAGECDSLPEFQVVDTRNSVDPNVYYCHRHVMMAVQTLRMNRALGLQGGGWNPYFSTGRTTFEPLGSAYNPGDGTTRYPMG